MTRKEDGTLGGVKQRALQNVLGIWPIRERLEPASIDEGDEVTGYDNSRKNIAVISSSKTPLLYKQTNIHYLSRTEKIERRLNALRARRNKPE